MYFTPNPPNMSIHTSKNHIFATNPHFIKIISESDSPSLIHLLSSSLALINGICSSYPLTCIFSQSRRIYLFWIWNLISLQPLYISSKFFHNLIPQTDSPLDSLLCLFLHLLLFRSCYMSFQPHPPMMTTQMFQHHIFVTTQHSIKIISEYNFPNMIV